VIEWRQTRSRFGCTSAGVVFEETDDCTCYGGLEHYPHEPHCGLELIGYLPEDGTFTDEPSLLPTMLWDFGALP
jgi:hypothetical protein